MEIKLLDSLEATQAGKWAMKTGGSREEKAVTT